MPRGPAFAGHALERPQAMKAFFWSLPVVAAVGPMAKEVESLALCMRALLCEDMFNLDSTVPPLPFNEEVKDLKGGKGLSEELPSLRMKMSVAHGDPPGPVPTCHMLWVGKWARSAAFQTRPAAMGVVGS